jgi:outer membrane protein assembly factor BamB
LDAGVFKTYGPVVANLTVDDSGLYVASKDGTLTCLNRSTGRVKWQYIGGVPLEDSPRVTKDMVFQHVPGTGLVALSKAEGGYNRSPRWVAPEITQFLAEDDTYVYGRREDNAILAMEKATGRAAFASKRRDFRAFAVDTVGGTIYAVTATDRILAIKPVLTSGQVGELVWVPIAPIDAHAVASR